jgi:hypothetical protein
VNSHLHLLAALPLGISPTKYIGYGCCRDDESVGLGELGKNELCNMFLTLHTTKK